jgi:CxxC motif-containing protein
MKENLICISCPLGCRLEVEIEDKTITKITGNSCPRGEIYATEELLAPKRIVTATCRTDSEHSPRLSVKTDAPILKEHIQGLLDSIYAKTVTLPVQKGDVIISNFKDTGVNVLATRSLKK